MRHKSTLHPHKSLDLSESIARVRSVVYDVAPGTVCILNRTDTRSRGTPTRSCSRLWASSRSRNSWVSVSVVFIPFQRTAVECDDAGHVEVRILQCPQSLIEDAVARGIAIAADEVVDVSFAPDELAFDDLTACGTAPTAAAGTGRGRLGRGSSMPRSEALLFAQEKAPQRFLFKSEASRQAFLDEVSSSDVRFATQRSQPNAQERQDRSAATQEGSKADERQADRADDRSRQESARQAQEERLRTEASESAIRDRLPEGTRHTIVGGVHMARLPNGKTIRIKRTSRKRMD